MADPGRSDDEPGRKRLMGPLEVGLALGVKPQVVVNWIREGRAHPSAVDELGRFRFTESDVEQLRAGLGQRRRRPAGSGPEAGVET